VSDCRIGVFLCHCGSNIAGVLDMEKLEEYAKTLDNVVLVNRNLYTCSEPGLKAIKEAIAAENLDRVVVAAGIPQAGAKGDIGLCESYPLPERTDQPGGIQGAKAVTYTPRKRA